MNQQLALLLNEVIRNPDGLVRNEFIKRFIPAIESGNVNGITGNIVNNADPTNPIITQAQSDWNEADNSKPDFIKNKPVVKYKVYSALLTQAGIADPTVIVLDNTLSAAVVWSRTGVGTYTGVLAAAFTANKTWVIVNGNASGTNITVAAWTDANTITVTTFASGVASDDTLSLTAIEVRVYS